jgi:hypothetical protein
VRAACIALVAAAAASVAWVAYRHATQSEAAAPSCTWPVRMRGTATAQQAGLVRCYLRALAGRNIAGLYAVAANLPPVRITAADLRYSADAQAGPATATIIPDQISTSVAAVMITYADGVTENVGMTNLVAVGGPYTWRMMIGQ